MNACYFFQCIFIAVITYIGQDSYSREIKLSQVEVKKTVTACTIALVTVLFILIALARMLDYFD